MVSSSASLNDAYQALLAAGDLQPDPAQAVAVKLLQQFIEDLTPYAAAERTPDAWSLSATIKNFWSNKEEIKGVLHGHCGLYIYGKVGRGKSMLMDLLFAHAPLRKKRRVHFHQFMLEIHERLNTLRQEHQTDDIVDHLVQGIAAETTLLCFDEFHVSNIADAMILGRLFSGLFARGVLIVSTSNSAPDDLYKNGLQRDRFLPFIDLIREKMEVLEMNGKTDYRYEQLRDIRSYFSPLNEETTRQLQGIFLDLTHSATPEEMVLHVNGRELRLERAAQGIGFFNFDELCKNALGAADYLAIASCLHTIILDDVPTLKEQQQRNEALRFITLIDVLYEAHVNLFMASQMPIEKLAVSADLEGPFQRTVSRLMEMQGEHYRSQPHKTDMAATEPKATVA